MKLGVLDIGSNSLKVSVFDQVDPLKPIFSSIQEVRISTGISKKTPEIEASALERALPALKILSDEAKAHGAEKILVVATSAIRDASNREATCKAIEADIGQPVRVLSGEEEAAAIATGVLQSIESRPNKNFTIIDLGGGSLECIRCKEGTITTLESLPIGSVRLAESVLNDLQTPIPPESLKKAAEVVQSVFDKSLSSLSQEDLPLIGTSGACTITRLIFANQDGLPFEASPRELPLERLRSLRDDLAKIPANMRSDAAPGLPAPRADVFPISLTILIAIAAMAKSDKILHSSCNLRQGIACQHFG